VVLVPPVGVVVEPPVVVVVPPVVVVVPPVVTTVPPVVVVVVPPVVAVVPPVPVVVEPPVPVVGVPPVPGSGSDSPPLHPQGVRQAAIKTALSGTLDVVNIEVSSEASASACAGTKWQKVVALDQFSSLCPCGGQSLHLSHQLPELVHKYLQKRTWRL
jgi:hypothetical protein